MSDLVKNLKRLSVVAAWLMLAILLPVNLLRAEDIVVNPVILQPLAESEVPAVQEGQIMKILVREGDRIEPEFGVIQLDEQLSLLRRNMARIESDVAIKKANNRADLNLSEVEIKVATANLQRAQASRQRFPDTPSQAEVDELELRLAQAKQHREKAEHELHLAQLAQQLSVQNLEAAEVELQRHLIKSPIPGVVTELIARPGDWVRPGQVLVRVVQLDRLKAEGRLIIRAGQASVLGAEVMFRTDGKNPVEAHVGQVVFVSPEVDPNDNSQRIVAEISNEKGRLSPGLRGQLLILVP